MFHLSVEGFLKCRLSVLAGTVGTSMEYELAVLSDPVEGKSFSLTRRWKRTYWGTKGLHHAVAQRAVNILPQSEVDSGTASMSTKEERTGGSTGERRPMV